MTNSPTGRLSRSEPEVQFFPGTPQALAQTRRLRAAREAREATGAPPFISLDFSDIELRILATSPATANAAFSADDAPKA